jgi:hypothetical protein
MFLVACLFVSFGALVDAQRGRFTDEFELNSFWSIHEQNGSVGLSSEVSHSGDLSLKLMSTPGGQREVWLAHVFPTARKGTLSVWFYDTPAGTSTLYAGLYADDTANPTNDFAVNVADWNPSHYVWHGPGVSETPTSVPRTNGWHEFRLVVSTTGFDALIDGTVVGTIPGDFVFDRIRLLLSGPASAPDATFFFDDFKFLPIN